MTFLINPSRFGGILASDTFTDINGTALNAHTMDIGTGWTHQNGTFQVQSNHCEVNSIAADPSSIATTDVSAADLTIEGNVTFDITDASNYSAGGLIFRYVDNNNLWFIGVDPQLNTLQIFERTTGTWTLRDGSTPTVNNGIEYALKVTTSGNVITGWLDDANVVTYTSASHNTATLHGLRGVNVGTPTNQTKWNNWTATA